LTMLYRSTDRRCRTGAPVKYLAHNASFHSLEKYAPRNAGTKQLIRLFLREDQTKGESYFDNIVRKRSTLWIQGIE
jgi:hypothetical protein